MRARGARAAWVVAPLLVLAGCGAAERPDPVEPLPDATPADLCATIPAALRAGLVSDSSVDEDGTPTAACSLRSPVRTEEPVTGLVTWLRLDDDEMADDALESQCRSVDLTAQQRASAFTVEGAEKACGASGTGSGGGTTTMAGVNGRQLVTVRWTTASGSAAEALDRGRQLMAGVLAELAPPD